MGSIQEYINHETKTRGLELGDEKLEGPTEDRQEESLSQKEDGKV